MSSSDNLEKQVAADLPIRRTNGDSDNCKDDGVEAPSPKNIFPKSCPGNPAFRAYIDRDLFGLDLPANPPKNIFSKKRPGIRNFPH